MYLGNWPFLTCYVNNRARNFPPTGRPRPRRDEFHSRLKFNHRGLVACANQVPRACSWSGSQAVPMSGHAAGTRSLALNPGISRPSRWALTHPAPPFSLLQNKRDTNGSQFFVTLDRADHCNRQYTIFGKVTGERQPLPALRPPVLAGEDSHRERQRGASTPCQAAAGTPGERIWPPSCKPSTTPPAHRMRTMRSLDLGRSPTNDL